MKKIVLIGVGSLAAMICHGQIISRPDVCPKCVEDTTGGYISIDNTAINNPVCNYELLTASHVALAENLKLSRKELVFYPASINKAYDKSGDDRGHVISFEDLGYSKQTAYASYDLRRNLAPQPHDQNVGTKYATEKLGRALASQYGSVKVYGGTSGTVGVVNGVNKPAFYWTVIITPKETLSFKMPTTGTKVTEAYRDDPEIKISYTELVGWLGFDPQKLLP